MLLGFAAVAILQMHQRTCTIGRCCQEPNPTANSEKSENTASRHQRCFCHFWCPALWFQMWRPGTRGSAASRHWSCLTQTDAKQPSTQPQGHSTVPLQPVPNHPRLQIKGLSSSISQIHWFWAIVSSEPPRMRQIAETSERDRRPASPLRFRCLTGEPE